MTAPSTHPKGTWPFTVSAAVVTSLVAVLFPVVWPQMLLAVVMSTVAIQLRPPSRNVAGWRAAANVFPWIALSIGLFTWSTYSLAMGQDPVSPSAFAPRLLIYTALFLPLYNATLAMSGAVPVRAWRDASLLLAAVAIALMSKNPALAGPALDLVVGLGVFACIAALFFDRAGGAPYSPAPSPRSPWAVLGIWTSATALTLMLAVPLASLSRVVKASAQNDEVESPMKKSTASAAPVFSAFFANQAPSDPYWRWRFTYNIPLTQSQWTVFPSEVFELSRADKLAPLEEARFARAGAARKDPPEYSYRIDALAQSGYSNGEYPLEGSIRLPLSTLKPGQALFQAYSQVSLVDATGALAKPREFDLFLVPPPNSVAPAPADGSLRPRVGSLDVSELSAQAREYTRLSMPKTFGLVEGWKAQGLEGRALVEKTLEHFSQNLAYHFDHQSMDPARNQVDHFLFVERKGVCRHFANAFALMMRIGGVPARVVVGFRGGDFDPNTNAWTVRARDAHAWTEVWLAGEGWVRVDPTDAVPVEKGVPPVTDAAHWWGRVFGSSRPPAPSSSFSTAGSADQGQAGLPASGNAWNHPPAPLPPGVATLPKGLMVVLGVLALAAVWAWARAPRPPPAERAWRRLCASLMRQGFPVSPSQGPRTVGLAVEPSLHEPLRADWRAAVARFERWKFAGTPDPDLARDLRSLRWRLLWFACRRGFRRAR